MSKPTKLMVYVNAATTVLFAVTAALYFIGGKPILGSIWCFSTAMFAGATYWQLKAYRINLRNYEEYEQYVRPLYGRQS